MPSIDRTVVMAKAHVDMLCDMQRPLKDSLAALQLVADYAAGLVKSFPDEYNAHQAKMAEMRASVQAAANTAVPPASLPKNTVTGTGTTA